MFIDLDHFKMVNDTHGHLVGSRLLAEIGNALKVHCRLIDFAFRYGGDEFVILLPQTSKDNALNVARRLGHPVYDCVYLALAEREHARFVTADHRLLRRLSTRRLDVAIVDLRTV